jgi:Methyltransferase domain
MPEDILKQVKFIWSSTCIGLFICRIVKSFKVRQINKPIQKHIKRLSRIVKNLESRFYFCKMKENIQAQFLETLTQSIDNQTFTKLTLSKSVGDTDLKNIYVRLVEIKKQLQLSFTYRYKTRDEVKNYPNTVDEGNPVPNAFGSGKGVVIISDFLGKQFLNAELFLTDATHLIQFDKNGLNPKIFIKKNKIVAENAQNTEGPLSANHDHEKQRLISPKSLYLNALDITTKDGLVKNDSQHKFRQINKYVEIIDNLLNEKKLPNDAVIADFGSGKGYLTFALYDHLAFNKKMNPSILGFELRENLVEKCNKIAQQSDFKNLKFVAQDINDFKINRLDMLIALHACDIATDIAIAKGIEAGAEIIVVAPCCHKQIRNALRESDTVNEMSPILKNGIMEERQAELLTDGIRALLMEANGYRTKVFEFISTEHTPKNVMIVGIKSKAKKEALKQVAALKSHYGISHHHLETLLPQI